jgi:hypothetical protein
MQLAAQCLRFGAGILTVLTMLITEEDLYRLRLAPAALASWHMARAFSGSEQEKTDRYVHSLALRGCILGWPDEKIGALVERWRAKNGISEDLEPRLTLLLPSARERARTYVEKWSAEHKAAVAKKAQKAAARPRARILSAFGLHKDRVSNPAELSAELGIKADLCRQTMRRMALHGELTKTSYGRYQLV